MAYKTPFGDLSETSSLAEDSHECHHDHELKADINKLLKNQQDQSKNGLLQLIQDKRQGVRVVIDEAGTPPAEAQKKHDDHHPHDLDPQQLIELEKLKKK